LLVVGVVFLGILIQRRAIWVPLESIETSDHGTFAAYVVAENDEWTTVLTPKWIDRRMPGGAPLYREHTKNIASRGPCALDLYEAKTVDLVFRLRPLELIDFLWTGSKPKPQTPSCPTA
jgi:hypothetical protein